MCLFSVRFATGIGAWYRTNSDAQELLTTALNRGQNLWDTSDCYGQAESALGSWFTANPQHRSEVFLCSKFSACNFAKTLTDDFKPDSDPRYINMALQRSLYMSSWSKLLVEIGLASDKNGEVEDPDPGDDVVG